MAPSSPPLRPAVFNILLALARHDLHGLGVVKEVERATAGSVRLGPGTLYRSLREMTEAGLIEEVSAPPGEDDPRRRFYCITERGRRTAGVEADRLARLVDVAREVRVLPDVR